MTKTQSKEKEIKCKGKKKKKTRNDIAKKKKQEKEKKEQQKKKKTIHERMNEKKRKKKRHRASIFAQQSTAKVLFNIVYEYTIYSLLSFFKVSKASI